MNKADTMIPREEGYLVEFKDFSGAISVSELSKTICAFANTDGGDVYLGVTDKRQIKGLNVTPLLLDHIQNAAREGCSPPIPLSLRQIPLSDHRTVLKISVEKSSHLHSVASGQSYIRVGTQDKRIMGDELLRLAETKTQVSYEEKVLEHGIEVIDLDSLNQYYESRKTFSALRKNLSPEELLLKIGLAESTQKQFRIKAGAFILFGKESESVLLQRDFTFVRYDAEGKIYSYREDLSLPTVPLLERLMELIRPYNRKTEGIKGLMRQEHVFYPEEAIREVLLNAFAHRDYRLSGLKNECRLYPHRLEMISAGGLPSFVTLENMDHRHYSRNPKIMHALLMLGLVEELGQGITLMKNALKKNGNPLPEFVASQDQFKVIFQQQTLQRSSEDIEKLLQHHFMHHEFLSRSQLEVLTGLRSTRVKQLLRHLIEKGEIIPLGKGRNTKYKRK